MKRNFILIILLTVLLYSCQGEAQDSLAPDDSVQGSTATTTLTLMTHDSFAISEETIRSFEDEHNAQIVLLPAGDTGSVLNQAILAKDDPLADILFGIDNTFLGRALDSGIFSAYEPENLSSVPDEFILDNSYRLVPVDYGYVCLNIDLEWFAEAGLDHPQSLADLTDPVYQDLLVVENPATSSPGLAFLLATIGVFGEEGGYSYLDYWRELRESGVMVTQGWEDAYFGQFSAASDGSRPMVVSYASSPPAEVLFADPPVSEPPTAAISSPNTCFEQIEFAGILEGTEVRSLAEKFIEFMLDEPFQEDIPLNMFVFPANEEAELPELFLNWAAIPEVPVTLDSQEINLNRDRWIEEWTEAVLR